MRAQEAHADAQAVGAGSSLRELEEPDGLALQAWQAQLRLEFAPRRTGTTLVRSSHQGPLRVQRPFYPEGLAGPCHVYVLHPPGGIVGGDRLLLDVRLESQSRALLTAPGANKLYRARQGASASLLQRFAVEQGAMLEWLPPETIAFQGTDASLATHVELAADATYVGWELLCLGRTAAGEGFQHGQLTTELSVRRAGKLVYFERGRYRAGDAMLQAPWGLSGRPVLATFLVASPRADASWLEQVRAQVSTDIAGDSFAVTLVSGILIARYLGGSTREARTLFERTYGVLRPLYAGLGAVHPRIWST
jgi:urease accessory protein